MNEPATPAQQARLGAPKTQTGYEFRRIRAVAGRSGRGARWGAVRTSGSRSLRRSADDETRRGLNAAHASRARLVKGQAPAADRDSSCCTAKRADRPKAGRFPGPAGGRAPGRIRAEAGRAAGLDLELHRLGRPGHRPQGQGGDLRRRPLHHPGARAGRRQAVRDPAPDHRAAGGLDRRQPEKGRGAGLRPLADHARCRAALSRSRAQGRR